MIGTGLIFMVDQVEKITLELTNALPLHDVLVVYPQAVGRLIYQARMNGYDEVVVVKTPSLDALTASVEDYLPRLRDIFNNNKWPKHFIVFPTIIRSDDALKMMALAEKIGSPFFSGNMKDLCGIPSCDSIDFSTLLTVNKEDSDETA